MSMRSDRKSLNLAHDEKNEELKNCISIIIDSEKINYKMKMPLNSENSDAYYLLNYDWFRKYLELNNINEEIYENLVNSVKNNINISNINLQNEIIIKKIISQINPNIKKKIKKEKSKYYQLENNELFNLDSSSFITKEYNRLKYYYNFIIISTESKKVLNKDFSFDYKDKKFLILLGDNKAFIEIKNQFVIEICYMNNKNIFIPELFFYFFEKDILKNNLNLLGIDGYENYIQKNLLFDNDYTSPIFDNKDIIGHAFKYDPSIKDYSIYQINEQLKAMIKLYFNHAQLKNKFNSDELLFYEKFLLLDIKYIQKLKEIYDYNNLEKELNNNTLAKQTIDSLGKNNKNIEDNFLNDKKITLIIKNLPEEININYNKKLYYHKKIDCQEMPDLIPFNNNIFYYNNFEIIDKSIIDLLFGTNINYSLYQEKENYLQCTFIEKYILINISKINSKCILEVCIIEDNNNINPVYLLEYDYNFSFINHFYYVKSLFGFKIFFESLDFTSNDGIQMNDEKDQKVGTIYNLEIHKNVNTILLPINKQNSYNNLSNVDNHTNQL